MNDIDENSDEDGIEMWREYRVWHVEIAHCYDDYSTMGGGGMTIMKGKMRESLFWSWGLEFLYKHMCCEIFNWTVFPVLIERNVWG